MPSSLLIRADASARIGTGHVMRCLALAQEFQRTVGRVLFVQAETTSAIERRLRAEGFVIASLDVTPGSTEDARATVRLAREQDVTWIVADGYHFDAEYQRHLKENELRLLLIDDYGHAEHYWAHYVLNQNLSADPMLYKNREPYTRLLFGTKYVLLRQEFHRWRDWEREIPTVAHKVLVTLGGADPDNATSKIMEALLQIRDEQLECVVVIGGSNPHLEKLKAAICHLPSAIRLVVDATNMPELMAWADVAIAAGGTTSWELAFIGLPSVAIVLADNQAAIAASLEREGVSVNLGASTNVTIDRIADAVQSLLNDPDRRRQMSRSGRSLVDGLGVCRVITRMQAARLTLRRAGKEDCQLIWEWANDPEARAVSFSPDPIPWESHMRWYAGKADDPNCFFYVAANGSGHPLGQIRFERTGREAIVSVSLAPSARGKGIGSALIVRGAEQFFAESNADLVRAFIKMDNLASARAFEKADFKDAGVMNVRGQEAKHFVLARATV